MKTYDIIFNDDFNSNNKGFRETFEYCRNWIAIHNGSNYSYFADYKGGTVSIICNESEEYIHIEEVI